MATAVLGTANLYSLLPDDVVEPLLHAAWDAGFRDFDTAPSYGFGRSEATLGRFLATRTDDTASVTTKVGIAAAAPPGVATRAAKSLARRLPGRVQDKLRGDAPPGGGHFDVAFVRSSVEESLRRLPRIDRLVLHEVAPSDITADLLELLSGYVERGDVGRLGVATSNERTAPALGRGAGRLDVAHVSVAPSGPALEFDDEVFVVGHGALGAGGAALRALGDSNRDPDWRARWDAAAVASPSADPAEVLLARAATRPGLDALIVATSRPERLGRTREIIATAPAPEQTLCDLVDEACAPR